MPIRPNFVCFLFNLEIRARSVTQVSDVTNRRSGEQQMRRDFNHHSVHNENATRMCGRGMRRAADQRVAGFVDTHADMNFLLRVSVMHLPAFARLIFGRWKELSLRMKPPSLPILQGIYPDRPRTRLKLKKEKP